MSINRKLMYRLDGISHAVVKPLVKNNTPNYIKVVSIDEEDEETFHITLSLGGFTDKLKRYIRNNDGYITIQMGNIDGGHSRHACYSSKTTGKTTPPDRNPKTHPSRCFNKSFEFDVYLDDLNNTTTYDFYVAKEAFTRNIEIGGYDYKRTLKPAEEAIREWPYIIYKIMFRYLWDPGEGQTSCWIINSDQILAYSRYIPINNGKTQIYTDNDFSFNSMGYYPWVYNENDECFDTISNHYGSAFLWASPSQPIQRLALNFHVDDYNPRNSEAVHYMIVDIDNNTSEYNVYPDTNGDGVINVTSETNIKYVSICNCKKIVHLYNFRYI